MKALATESVVHPLVAFTNVVLLPISGFVVGGALGAMGGPLERLLELSRVLQKQRRGVLFLNFFFLFPLLQVPS